MGRKIRKGRFYVFSKLLSKLDFISSIKEIVKNIPRAAWAVAAFFGIFMFGLVLGFTWGQEDATLKPDPNKDNMLEVISAYEKIGNLYYQQGEDVSIMTNTNLWTSSPEEVVDAIQSYKQKRDEIIFQQGVISESRKRAGLSGSEERL